jgi:putative addiction module component (TIGR02574 family)
MTAKVKSLAEVVVNLPAEDRTYLAERLLASLDETDLEQQWAVEAKRRLDEIRSGAVETVSAEEVYRRIDRLLGK